MWPYLELGRLRWTVFAPQRLVTVSSTSTSRASAGAPVNQDDSDRSHWRAPGHRPQERRGAVDMLTPLRGVTVLSKPHRSTPQRAALVPIFHASSVREAREASLDPHRQAGLRPSRVCEREGGRETEMRAPACPRQRARRHSDQLQDSQQRLSRARQCGERMTLKNGNLVQHPRQQSFS